ncbi:MAG TPA: OprD family outer membrane porin [Flavobacteriales bacterium]|nr:OprD family outer membrane porin [Flavobacteriales bacterium]
MRKLLFPLLALLTAAASAQNTDQDLPHSDSLRQGAALHDVIRKGTLEGRFRLFLMGTLNDGAPADYHAQAFGGSLGFASQRWKGLQFRMSGGYAFDLGSSDLTAPDPITGQPNRYEIGLFDVTAPRKDNQLAYLQLFQLNYRSRSERTLVVLGRQEINTPFINPQDGRMQPSLAEGLWSVHRTNHGLKLEGGLLYGFSPRSTAGWYSTEKSFGLYPVGVGVNGRPSRYAGNTTSAGVAMAGAQWSGPRKLTFMAWEMLTANISNTAMLQIERGTRDDRWMVGAMAIRQDRVSSGGNKVDSLAYFQSDASMAFSGRLRMNLGRFRWQLNYTRITADGRYLMPREWGRDPFYTFLPRERNEGLGDVHAATVNLIWKTRTGWRIQGDVGRYWLPAVTDAILNKYVFPSYMQFGLNAQYQFKGDWKGLAIQFLNVAKLPASDAAYTTRQAMNKVDMFHTELVVNYAF